MIRVLSSRAPSRLVFFASTVGFALVSTGAYALDTVTLDNLSLDGANGMKATIPHVEFVGTNLTKDEVQRLFTPGLSKEDGLALISKLVATRITIPQVAFADKDGKFSFTGLQATDIDTGKVGHFNLAGFEGDVPGDGGRVVMKSGPMALDGAGLSGLLSAMTKNDFGGATSHFGHFSWQNVEMTTPDKETPASTPGGNMYKFVLGSLSIDATFDGDVPLKTSGVIKNLVVEPPPGSQSGQQLAGLGYKSVDLGFSFTTVYDPAQKNLNIDDLTLSVANMGAVTFKTQLGGVDRSLFNGASDARIAALLGGAVAGLEIRFVNAGSVEKALSVIAQQQGKTPEALRAEASAMATQVIPAMLGGNPVSLKIAEQAAKFIANPKTLTVSAKPKAGPIGFMEAMSLMDPSAFLDKVDVTVLAQADGPAPAAAPAAPAPAAAAPAPAPAAAAPAAAQRLTGLAAWSALVGNSITGKNSDDDLMTEFYMPNGKVKQIVDNEISTGDWVVRGAKVCIEYPDDDDETCYDVVVEGNFATFTDEDGDGRRYEIQQGNPKKL